MGVSANCKRLVFDPANATTIYAATNVGVFFLRHDRRLATRL